MGGTRAATHLLGGSFRLYLAPFSKTKTPSGPCSAQEGVRIFLYTNDCARGGPGIIVTPVSFCHRLRGDYGSPHPSIN